MKLIILQEAYETLLSPSADHKTFAKITQNQAALWQDFGRDLAMKMFKLTQQQLSVELGTNKRGQLNGFINWYKVDEPGFVPTGYRDLQNNPDQLAKGFVVKYKGETFGFNISKDYEKREVVFGNAFMINTRTGLNPDWHKHLQYFIDTGKKALNANVKEVSDSFFNDLGKKVGYKPILIENLLYHFRMNSNRFSNWNAVQPDLKKWKFLSATLFKEVFTDEKIYNTAVQHFNQNYPNLDRFKDKRISFPMNADFLEENNAKFEDDFDRNIVLTLLEYLESDKGVITKDYKEFVNAYGANFRKYSLEDAWKLINKYSEEIKDFLNRYKN